MKIYILSGKPMALKPYYQIIGKPPQPQFFLKDRDGREFGVVEHYETDRSRPASFILLEFFSPAVDGARRPLVWLDLEKWSVLHGRGKHIPDEHFEPGLDAYLQSLPEAEKETRRERARKARFADVIRLAEQGYTVAYQELFPGELRKEDFPLVEISGRGYLVDDQYTIQPGDFRNQVTLVFVEAGAGSRGAAAPGSQSAPEKPALLCNWLFGVGYDILESELREDLCHQAIKPLVENPELEKIYRERLAKMRRQATLLGVQPKPYEPRAGSGSP
jgi:hypothetical protein